MNKSVKPLSVEDGTAAKQRVLARWRNAHCTNHTERHRPEFPNFKIFSSKDWGAEWIGTGTNEESAWTNAASKLSEPMNTKGVEDGMSDVQDVCKWCGCLLTVGMYATCFRSPSGWCERTAAVPVAQPTEDGIQATSMANVRDGGAFSQMVGGPLLNSQPPQTLDALLLAIRSATPEELAAQRESRGKNYKPGPRQATPFMPAAVPVEERTLSMEVRKQLWLTHGCGISCLYGDDGEMQCGRFIPAIDFRRDPEAAILEGIDIHCRRRWSEVQAKPPIPEERTAEIEQLMGRLRIAAQKAVETEFLVDISAFNSEACPENILLLLDHIEGTAK